MENGTRFEFGENWQRFLAVVDESRISEAEKSLQALLGLSSLAGKTFLDIGSGSGLSSLAAVRKGAVVRSLDYDTQSVACTRELKQRFSPASANWRIEQGSVLDDAYMDALGNYDIVYSWGVLHHTGEMWRAIGNAARRVQPQGLLVIALYNDQGLRSKVWHGVKRLYNALPAPLQPLYTGLFFPLIWGPTTVRDLFRGNPFATYRGYASRRGMSPWRDMVDWVGGLPFEVAKAQAVIDFARTRGFELVRLNETKGLGCSEFVFRSGKMK